METTSAILSDIERKHKCVIKRDIPPADETEEPGITPPIKQPCKPTPSVVSDKELKGVNITVVVGDLAQQKVYKCGIMYSACPFNFCSSCLIPKFNSAKYRWILSRYFCSNNGLMKKHDDLNRNFQNISKFGFMKFSPAATLD